jgi:hypothetical protein
MTYRRRGYRAGSRPASTFRRDARYEVSKEGLGKFLEKLGEWGGAALGLAAGAAAVKHGLPVNPTIASGTGLALGAAAGAAAKGTLVAAFDNLKKHRADRRERLQATGETTRQPRGLRRGLRGTHRVSAARAASSGGVSAGALMTEVERVIAELERAERELVGIGDRFQSTQGWVMILLAGGRTDVLQEVNGRMRAVRAAITDSCTLLRLSKDDLRGYLRSI